MGNGTAAGTAAVTGNDTGIAAIILGILGIAGAVTEYLRRRSQSNTRSDNFNNAGEEGKASVKETDKAIKDHSDMFHQLTKLLLFSPDLRKIFAEKGRPFMNSVNKDLLEWQRDFGAYYDRQQKLDQDNSRDRIIRDTAKIRKSFLPDYTGMDPTSTNDIEQATDKMLEDNKPPLDAKQHLYHPISADFRGNKNPTNHPDLSIFYWNQGDIIYDAYPTPGGSIGWVCTAPGTPGEWRSFGSISLKP
jgi:hypothetical protein